MTKKIDEADEGLDENLNEENLTEEELDAQDDEIGEQDVDDDSEEEETEESKLRDQLLRTHAQIENIKRRAERDVSHAHKYATDKLLQELIPIMDSLEQALQAEADTGSDQFKTMREGMELTLQMFVNTLAKFGVKQIDPLHEMFDPNNHEAMTMAEGGEHKTNTVINVIQKGYVLHDRVVRPARVIVAK